MKLANMFITPRYLNKLTFLCNLIYNYLKFYLRSQMSKDLQEKRRAKSELCAKIRDHKLQITKATKVLETLTDDLEKALPNVES